jgi:hypothetical protein
MDFSIDSHAKAYVCRHVFEQSHPILLVSRADGDWCFLCGGVHANDAGEYRVVGIGYVLEVDRTLLELRDLPVDWEAERQNTDSVWVRIPLDRTSD